MQRRRLLLSLALLPTITETLEDSVVPTHPSSSSSSCCSQSLEEYMTSIQALARAEAAPSCGPVRLHRTTVRPRMFANPLQGKQHSVLLARGIPRILLPRTTTTVSRNPLSMAGSAEDVSPRTPGRQRDCGVVEEPADRPVGQSQNRPNHQTRKTRCREPRQRETLAAALWVF